MNEDFEEDTILKDIEDEIDAVGFQSLCIEALRQINKSLQDKKGEISQFLHFKKEEHDKINL